VSEKKRNFTTPNLTETTPEIIIIKPKKLLTTYPVLDP
jgi:hypothetical protein